MTVEEYVKLIGGCIPHPHDHWSSPMSILYTGPTIILACRRDRQFKKAGSSLPFIPLLFSSSCYFGDKMLPLVCLSLFASAVLAQSSFSPTRPPAIPLAVSNPYLNTWQQAGSDGGNGGYVSLLDWNCMFFANIR
jgi:hypothetical protein